MNYVETVNQFWRLRRSKRITNLQADLYFFLLNESSSRGIGSNWENPFQCPNGLVCSAIGISEKSLIDARNVLQQIGLIEFESGVTKQKAPVYHLVDYWNKVSNPVSIPGGKQGGNPVSIPGGNDGNIIRKKPNQTKPNKTSSAPASPAPPKKSGKKKKEEEPEPYWQDLVGVWFRFNVKKFLAGHPGADPKDGEPSFERDDPKIFKRIISRLKARAAARKVEWTETEAVARLEGFLQKCDEDDWLSKHFLLANLEKQFDSIILNHQAAAAEKKGKPTPAKVPPKSDWEEVLYLLERHNEGAEVEQLIQANHFDILVSRGAIPVGLIDASKPILEQQRYWVLKFFKQNATVCTS